MSCGFEEDLTAYVDRELPPLRLRQLEEHLPSCGDCAGTLALIRGAVRALEAMPAFVPSPQLRREVLNRISEEVPLLDRLRAWLGPRALVPALSACAVLALAVVAVQLGRGPRPQPEDPPLLLADASDLELVQNMELMEDMDVLGLESPEDLDVVEHLQELEGQP